ncbi:bro-d [Leucania separata nucleopolyhedrovirus]|uniref:Bro-d n=1 Tax=Leucania separata nucleopolyhedrovirus TaxID=1307956 RepID=Q0IL66_NPVLS|nr:bro-d [Leucania separata nucleopolyhedrovirus]AAR28817.1 bro-d [Leucania separata nucleopolyhedrovirus]
MSLQRFEFPLSDDASGAKFECWGVILPPDGVAIKLKELAEFLGYENVKHAYALIPNEWKIKLKDLQLVRNSDHHVAPSTTPSNWQPETLFVLEPGVYALLARSNKPMAKQIIRRRVLRSNAHTLQNVSRKKVLQNWGIKVRNLDHRSGKGQVYVRGTWCGTVFGI